MDPITAVLNVGNSLIERLWPDPKMQSDQKLKLAEMAQNKDLTELERSVQLLMGQLEINKVEAAHKSLFVAGWRPFVGWVCGFGLLYQCALERFISIWVEVPQVDSSTLLTVLMGMLGLGGMRSFEKFKGVSREK